MFAFEFLGENVGDEGFIINLALEEITFILITLILKIISVS